MVGSKTFLSSLLGPHPSTLSSLSPQVGYSSTLAQTAAASNTPSMSKSAPQTGSIGSTPSQSALEPSTLAFVPTTVTFSSTTDTISHHSASGTDIETPHTTTTHIGPIIGGFAAGLILLAAVLTVIWRMRQKRKFWNGSSLAVASVPVFQDIAVHDSDDPRSMPHNGDSLLAWRSAHARDISDNDSMVINPRVNNMDATAEQSVDEKTRTENMSREEPDTAACYISVAEVLPISIHAGQTESITEEPRRQIRLLDSGIRFLYESPRPATGSDISELPPEYTEH